MTERLGVMDERDARNWARFHAAKYGTAFIAVTFDVRSNVYQYEVLDPLAVSLTVTPSDAREKRRTTLTLREREIAALVAEGLGNKEIAKRLYISSRTVDVHLQNVFAKVGTRNRTELARLVLTDELNERRPE